jgi:hypothetical protein
MIGRASMKEVQDHLGQEIKALRHRMEELESQLQALRLRVGGVEKVVGSVVQMDATAFRHALRDAFERLNAGQRGFGIVAVADLRRALGTRVSRAAFDEQVIRLHDDGIIQLMAAPGAVTDERQKDAVVHPTQGALFYLRWERQL